MTKFLKKRWHSIPIGIISAVMLVVLLAGSVFAAYGFKSFTTKIEVTEPMSIDYNLWGKYTGDSEWHPLGDTDSMTLNRMAGDDFAMSLRVTNDATNALTVNTVITYPSGGSQWFITGGFPNGAVDNCPGDTAKIFPVTIDVAGDAPAGDYDVTFTFTRK